MRIYIVTLRKSLGGEEYEEIIGAYTTDKGAEQAIYVDRHHENPGFTRYSYDIISTELLD